MSSSDSEDDYYGSSLINFQKLKNTYKEDKIETAELLKDLSVQTVLESKGHTAVNTTSFTPVVETEISTIAQNLVRQKRSQTNKGAISKRSGRGSTQGRGSKNKPKQSKSTEDINTDTSPNNFNVAAVKRSISQRPRRSHCIDAKRNQRNGQTNVKDKQTIYSVGDTEEYIDLTNDSPAEDDPLFDQIIAQDLVRQKRSQTNKGAISKRSSRGSTQGRGSKNKPKQSTSTEDSNTDISPNNFNVAAVKRSISQQPRGRHSIDTKRNRHNIQRNVEDKQTRYRFCNIEEDEDSSNDSLTEDDTLFAQNLVRQKRFQPNKGAISRSLSQPRRHHSINTEHNRQRNVVNEQIIYSVGNTEEYQDLSSGVLLFNTKPLLTVADNDLLDENEELSVKVYWRSSEIVKFTIRRYQKLLQIFDFFAKKENITTAKILLLYNDMILKPDDTPDKIDYKISKFIEGGIVNSVPILDSIEEFGNGIELKFQCQNVKKPFIIRVQKEDKFQTAMLKCSEYFEKPFKTLKFVFDGDAIQGSMTPEELELEGGECIDVKVVA
ncbi:uncharacterized protein LOC110993401 [Pieris rapae]|uniref:uncharacterized protein LOC110993401 n=1 Tax=Pieris rapae TaxID=64459 RepID=UPI001E27D917|nr:uncharacterized protein LOC110993401 [Pieris rapae]